MKKLLGFQLPWICFALMWKKWTKHILPKWRWFFMVIYHGRIRKKTTNKNKSKLENCTRALFGVLWRERNRTHRWDMKPALFFVVNLRPSNGKKYMKNISQQNSGKKRFIAGEKTHSDHSKPDHSPNARIKSHFSHIRTNFWSQSNLFHSPGWSSLLVCWARPKNGQTHRQDSNLVGLGFQTALAGLANPGSMLVIKTHVTFHYKLAKSR